MASLTCVQCGRTFQRCESYIRAQRNAGNLVAHCSMACVWAAKKAHAREERGCLRCGTAIWSYRSQSGNVKTERKYCSKACMDAYRSAMSTCAECGRQFKHFRAVPRKYCSARCAGVAKTDLYRKCLHCGSEFRYLPKDEATAKYCCFSCKVKHEGGKRRLPADHRNRCGKAAWRERRAEAIARDGGKCTRCGTAEDLTVHHIVKWRICRNDSLENLTTLCRACHFIVEFGGNPPAAVKLALLG